MKIMNDNERGTPAGGAKIWIDFEWNLEEVDITTDKTGRRNIARLLGGSYLSVCSFGKIDVMIFAPIPF